jgi:hypothetical protein
LPLLWPLLPLAAAISIQGAHRRLAIFCTVVVLVALLVHSYGGAKALRYIYYVMPLMSALWACALATVLVGAAAATDEGKGSARGAAFWTLAGVLTAGFLLSQEAQRTARLAAGRLPPASALRYAVEADWARSVARLEPLVQSADRVVTSNSMKALYYLGGYDYELNVSIADETETKTDFDIDGRTGRHAIGRAESVRQVLDLPGTTAVVLEEEKIGKPTGVPAEAVAVIESWCREVPLDAGAGVRAWRCGSAAR